MTDSSAFILHKNKQTIQNQKEGKTNQDDCIINNSKKIKRKSLGTFVSIKKCF